MKIVRVDVAVRRREPPPAPIRDALQTLTAPGSVRVTLQTDDGVSGQGDVSFGRISGAPAALAALIEHELKPLVLGTDPADVRHTHQEMLRETEYHGSFGLTMFGIAALDIALWDCLGKSMGVPCWRLWGVVRDRVPAYAMVGWLNYSDEQVQDICARAVAQGFGGVKVKVGYPTLKEDIHRLEVVRSSWRRRCSASIGAVRIRAAAAISVRTPRISLAPAAAETLVKLSTLGATIAAMPNNPISQNSHRESFREYMMARMAENRRIKTPSPTSAINAFLLLV